MQALCGGTWFGTGALNGCRGKRSSESDASEGWGTTVHVDTASSEGHMSLSLRLAQDRYEDGDVIIDKRGMRSREVRTGKRLMSRANMLESSGRSGGNLGGSNQIHTSVFDSIPTEASAKQMLSKGADAGGRVVHDTRCSSATQEPAVHVGRSADLVDDDSASIASTASMRPSDKVLERLQSSSRKQGPMRRTDHAEVENWLRAVPVSSLRVGLDLPPVSTSKGRLASSSASSKQGYKKPSMRNQAAAILEQYSDSDIVPMLRKVHRLGRGGGGIVWQATFDDGKQRFSVAVKEVPMTDDEEKCSMVVHEMKTLYEVQHPCIVKCHKVYFANSTFHMVMELVNGGSLLDLMKAAPERIPTEAVGAVCASLIRALAHLHDESRIMHRDVKPGNILISVNGEVKLADLGVCTRVEETPSKKWVGTATYMSPERMTGDEYSFSADVWSAGLVVTEAVMGMYPYLGHTKGESLEFWDLLDVLTTGPSTADILEAANVGASSDMVNFVAATMDRDPSARPTAAKALTLPWLSSTDQAGNTAALAQWARRARDSRAAAMKEELAEGMCGMRVCAIGEQGEMQVMAGVFNGIKSLWGGGM